MIDWDLQGVHAARSRAIHFLRRWEQGEKPQHLSLGVCGNLDDVLRYDHSLGRRIEQFRTLPTSMMLAYPYPRKSVYKAGQTLSTDVYDMVDTLCVDWPEAYGKPHYPIDGLAGYNDGREFNTLWEGVSGAKRRRLCGWLADMLEREEYA